MCKGHLLSPRSSLSPSLTIFFNKVCHSGRGSSIVSDILLFFLLISHEVVCFWCNELQKSLWFQMLWCRLLKSKRVMILCQNFISVWVWLFLRLHCTFHSRELHLQFFMSVWFLLAVLQLVVQKPPKEIRPTPDCGPRNSFGPRPCHSA